MHNFKYFHYRWNSAITRNNRSHGDDEIRGDRGEFYFAMHIRMYLCTYNGRGMSRRNAKEGVFSLRYVIADVVFHTNDSGGACLFALSYTLHA